MTGDDCETGLGSMALTSTHCSTARAGRGSIRRLLIGYLEQAAEALEHLHNASTRLHGGRQAGENRSPRRPAGSCSSTSG